MPYNIVRQSGALGAHLRAWRMVQGLTAQQVSQRAGISPMTLRKVENGDGGVRLDAVLQVARALGVLDQLVDAADPLNTDLGRARADQIARQRVR